MAMHSFWFANYALEAKLTEFLEDIHYLQRTFAAHYALLMLT